jgi:hypothetical protein
MNLKGHAYIAKNGEGFTTLPDLAKTVRVGDQDLPVLAPGITGYIRRAHYTNVNILWESLLDRMEDRYRFREEKNTDALLNLEPFIAGLETALALLRHGVADESAIKLTQAEAVARYNQET